MSRSYSCDYYSHLQLDILKTVLRPKVEGSCTCSLLPQVSATCCKKSNLMNILQHCPSGFCCRTFPWLRMQRSGFTVPAASERSVRPWLFLRFSTHTGNSTSSKLFCDRSRRWLHVQPGALNMCNVLQKVQFNEYSATLSQLILLQNLPLGTHTTFWFQNPCNIRKKCVASVSKNSRVWPRL